jgi:hypothetical protein
MGLMVRCEVRFGKVCLRNGGRDVMLWVDQVRVRAWGINILVVELLPVYTLLYRGYGIYCTILVRRYQVRPDFPNSFKAGTGVVVCATDAISWLTVRHPHDHSIRELELQR